MNRIIIHTIFTTLIFSVVATAQFRIKFPNIQNPKLPDTEKQATNSSHGSNVTSREMILDDGFTFFDAEVIEELDARVQRPVGKGWTLRSHLRLFGDFPARSGFNVAVSKAGKVLTKIRCEAEAYPDPNSYEASEGLVYGDHYIFTGSREGCMNKKKIVQGTGNFDVSVYFFNGDSDKETLVRKYKIDVHEATRVRGPVNKTVAAVPHYYIQRHAEVPASIMYLSADYAFNYFNRSFRSFPDQVQITFNYSPRAWNDGHMPHGYMRCYVNEKLVKFPEEDTVSPYVMREEAATYMDRLAAQYKRGGEYKDDVLFKQVTIPLPMSWGRKTLKRQPDRLAMQNYQGDWKCNYLKDGETIRTFRWKVGSDGMPIRHAEQKSGNINLFHNSYLIETEIPPGGSEFDHRLAPIANGGLFYGVPWTSAEGKIMAARVPKKGNLYHVPSTRAK